MNTERDGIALDGAVWMTAGGENLGGKGRITLLAAIEQTGSITQAARAIGMSYKAAWDAVDTMNNLAGEPLVARAAGGKGGGGTRLTPRGRQLVDNFRRIEDAHRRFVADLNRQAGQLADDYFLITRMGMKTSARNQFQGKVAAVRHGAVNDEVELEVTGGERIVAIVTHDSTESLGLTVGASAFALIKASSIIVVTDAQGAKFSARNQLVGTIGRIRPGAVNTEVTLYLPGGGAVSAIITNDSAERLALVQGMNATAIFKASSVIVGVPA